MYNKESAEKILNNLRTKFRCLNQVYDLTGEMDDALCSGDRQTLDIILDMRQKQLEVCKSMDDQNDELVKDYPEPEKAHMEGLLHTAESYSTPEDELEEQLLNLTKRIRALHMKTIDFDRKITDKIKNNKR